MRVAYSNILTAFEEECVGSKVLDEKTFIAHLKDELTHHGPEIFNEHGHAVIELPLAGSICSPGSYHKAGLKANDYVVREWRGEMSAFIKRDQFMRAENVSVVVYTIKGYLDDPEVDKEERISLTSPENKDVTHVLVAVLATMNKTPSQLSSSRLVRNLAGGNNAFVPKSKMQFGPTMDAHEYNELMSDVVLLHKVIDEAKKTVEYESVWGVVAD